MTDDIQTVPTRLPSQSQGYRSTSEIEVQSIEIAKILKLVAPAAMNADHQALWLASAVEALEGIRPHEISAVSLELRRTITRPAQIVPEIARLVSERRKRNAVPVQPEGTMTLWQIDRESERRRKEAKTQREIEEAWAWERKAKQDNGYSVPSIEPPLSRSELEAMPAHVRNLGLARGLLEYRDGQLVEVRL